MALGRKTGGRAAGTPNRRTVEVIERLEVLGCDPIEGMALIAMDATVPVEVRARMFAELAQYTAPKRKAIEYEGPALQYERIVQSQLAEMTEEQLSAIVSHLSVLLENEQSAASRLSDAGSVAAGEIGAVDLLLISDSVRDRR